MIHEASPAQIERRDALAGRLFEAALGAFDVLTINLGLEIERTMYAYSVLFCLPESRADLPSVATGTVMRPATLALYATEAGFSRFSVLPIEHEVFRLYRLDP